MKYLNQVLITGGTGQLGDYLTREFTFKNRFETVGSADYDLRNRAEVHNMFDHFRPRVVVHLAARVGGIQKNIDNRVQFLEDNVQMNTNVLQLAREFDVERVILAGSTCAYPEGGGWELIDQIGNPLSVFFKEDQILQGEPDSTSIGYAFSKRLMTLHARLMNESTGVKTTVLHFCNLFGEKENWKDPSSLHFLPALIWRCVQASIEGQSEIEVWGSGEPRRQFMHVKDAASAIRHVLNRPDLSGEFNVAPSRCWSIQHLVDMTLEVVKEESGLDLIQKWDRSRPDGQMFKSANPEKFIQQFPNWELTDLKEAIADVYKNVLRGAQEALYLQTR
jgi:GDP-L-fucose synthase